MEGEARKIRRLPASLPGPLRAERMGRILQDHDPPKCLLNLISGRKTSLFSLHNLINPLIIAHHAADIHGDNHLGPLCDRLLQLRVIHLIRAGRGVHQDHLRPHMACHAGACRVRVGACDHLIPGPHAQEMQRQFHAGRP